MGAAPDCLNIPRLQLILHSSFNRNVLKRKVLWPLKPGWIRLSHQIFPSNGGGWWQRFDQTSCQKPRISLQCQNAALAHNSYLFPHGQWGPAIDNERDLNTKLNTVYISRNSNEAGLKNINSVRGFPPYWLFFRKKNIFSREFIIQQTLFRNQTLRNMDQ